VRKRSKENFFWGYALDVRKRSKENFFWGYAPRCAEKIKRELLLGLCPSMCGKDPKRTSFGAMPLDVRKSSKENFFWGYALDVRKSPKENFFWGYAPRCAEKLRFSVRHETPTCGYAAVLHLICLWSVNKGSFSLALPCQMRELQDDRRKLARMVLFQSKIRNPKSKIEMGWRFSAGVVLSS
jgi:hypothetical protein